VSLLNDYIDFLRATAGPGDYYYDRDPVTGGIMPYFKRGDIVSRDGTDEHLIYDMNRAGDFINVICLKAPKDKWTAVGETEGNVARRYTLKEHLLNWREVFERLKGIPVDKFLEQ